MSFFGVDTRSAGRSTKAVVELATGRKASEDPISSQMYKQVRTFKDKSFHYLKAYDECFAAWEEYNKKQKKLAQIGVELFFEDDHLKKASILDSLQEYEDTMKDITDDVPKQLQEVMEDGFKEELTSYRKKLDKAWEDLEALSNTRITYDHYIEKTEALSQAKSKARSGGKTETPKQAEKLSRNRSKLKEAEDDYCSQRDELGESMDEFMVGGKAAYMEHVIMVMQFQMQIYKKSNKRAEKLEKIIAACTEAKSKKPSYWGEMSYDEWKTKVVEDTGGDENLKRTKRLKEEDDDERGGRRGSRKKKGKDESDSESSDDSEDERRRRRKKDKDKKEKKKKKKMHSSDEDSDHDGGVDISSIPRSHIDKLKEDPSLKAQFDKTYGKGAAAACLSPKKSSPKSSPFAKPSSDIPPEHIAKLKANPHFAPDFNKLYGAGAAEDILEKATNVFAIESSSMMINGHAVDKSHVDKLKATPSMAAAFDSKYGEGAAAQVLGSPKKDDLDDILAW